MEILKRLFYIFSIALISACAISTKRNYQEVISDRQIKSPISIQCLARDSNKDEFSKCPDEMSRKISVCLKTRLNLIVDEKANSKLTAEVVNRRINSATWAPILSVLTLGIVPGYSTVYEEVVTLKNEKGEVLGKTSNDIRIEGGWYFYIKSKLSHKDMSDDLYCAQIREILNTMEGIDK